MFAFGLVGLSGIGVNTAALWFLHHMLGLHPLLGAALATQASTAWNFVLIDTGVTTMYLTVPESQAAADIRIGKGRAATLVDGTKVMISIPAEDSPQALYTFVLGDGINPLAPAQLTLVDRTRPPFVNTSVRFLNGFDYLFDADGGFAGFRWTGHAADSFGKAMPTAPSN